MNIIGISFGFHESSVCLLRDGKPVFACAEERISRRKQDTAFPLLAIKAALKHGGLKPTDVDHVAFSWPKPFESFKHAMRLFATGQWPLSGARLSRVLYGFAKEVHHQNGALDYTRAFGRPKRGFHNIDHHYSHALSAYCLSGFDEASVLIMDGKGAREATTLWRAQGDRVVKLEQHDYPNSIGVFYAGITEMLGFEPFSDEWKVMGLASYGSPNVDLSRLITTGTDSYQVAGRRFFGKTDSDRRGLEEILGQRRDTEELNSRHMDLARSAQDACERAMMAMLRRVSGLTKSRNLCLAGGVALNCKANGELLRSGLIDDIYVQPAAGDDGACLGAAFAVYPRVGLPLPRAKLGHTYLGLEFSSQEIEQALRTYKIPFRKVENAPATAAELLNRNRLVGWFQGRMEFGPRALGSRSILSSPKHAENRDRVNEAVKFRESWRPFAPSVLAEKAHLYFQDFKESPYMILSFWADKKRAHEIPAVVHVDGSCRVQSVTRATNSRYYALLEEFEKLSGVPMLMNTSFNLKGDPIVCSPKDAIQTFYTSGLDDLVMGDYVVSKELK